MCYRVLPLILKGENFLFSSILSPLINFSEYRKGSIFNQTDRADFRSDFCVWLESQDLDGEVRRLRGRLEMCRKASSCLCSEEIVANWESYDQSYDFPNSTYEVYMRGHLPDTVDWYQLADGTCHRPSCFYSKRGKMSRKLRVLKADLRFFQESLLREVHAQLDEAREYRKLNRQLEKLMRKESQLSFSYGFLKSRLFFYDRGSCPP